MLTLMVHHQVLYNNMQNNVIKSITVSFVGVKSHTCVTLYLLI